MQQKIVIGSDNTWFSPIRGVNGHLAPAGETFEADVAVQHAPGSADHALAMRVLHKGQPTAQAFHNCGRYIPHIPNPVNPFSVPSAALGYAMSSRVCMFSAWDVLVEGQPIAFGLLANTPPTPMLICGTIPLPMGDADTSAENGVIVGIDPWDYVICCGGVTIEVGLAYALWAANTIEAVVTGGASTLAELFGGLGKDAVAGEASRKTSPGQTAVELARAYRSGDPEEIRQAEQRARDRARDAGPYLGPIGWLLNAGRSDSYEEL